MNDAPPPLYPQAPQPYAQPAPVAPPPRKSGCGLGGLGCGLGCLIAVAACVGLVIFGVFAAKNYFGKMVDEYTATEYVPITAPQASPEQVASAVEKFDSFSQGMGVGGSPVPLTLTGEELNLILWNHPNFAPAAGKANVAIEGDVLSSEVSLNFDELPIPEGFVADALKGKFFNGEVSLKLGMAAGQPALYLEGLAVNGNSVPDAFLSGMKSQNLLQDAAKNPEATAFFERIEDLRIEDGKLIIVPKANSTQP
jgi:hypothetical protein